MNFKIKLVLCLLVLASPAFSQKISLNGEWLFTLDPLKRGEQYELFKKDLQVNRWDKVKVPHSFNAEGPFLHYTGFAWYRKTIDVPESNNKRVFLHFEAVFYKCKIWLNGRIIGDHEGGYLPFELEITDQVTKGENLIALQVDNSWDTLALPGGRTFSNAADFPAMQFYPWMNYGGITRDVSLIIRPKSFIEKVKVEANPDLRKKTASVKVRVWLNQSQEIVKPGDINAGLLKDNKVLPVKFSLKQSGTSGVELVTNLKSSEVKLWDLGQPELYKLRLVLNGDTSVTTFGIRKVEIEGTKLMLNGKQVKLAGCNRPLDFPGHGSSDPKEVLEKDMRLIKEGNMELSRISHYPTSPELLDLADQYGMLIIGEAGNWQLGKEQMADSLMQQKFKGQFQTMVERDWNHPSIIAWSLGNEFNSTSHEGIEWVKTMYKFAKELDPSRLRTFASMYVFGEKIKNPEEEASFYVDFVSANIYGNYKNNLSRIHALYPGKPIYISEFGIRNEGRTEEERITHFQEAISAIRGTDYVIGASVWTFNDYQSRYHGTGSNGYRAWGLVDPNRDIRPLYTAFQKEFSPVTIKLLEGQKIEVGARNSFPVMDLDNIELKVLYKDSNGKEVGNDHFKITKLSPGKFMDFKLSSESTIQTIEAEVRKSNGFITTKETFDLKEFTSK